MKFYVDTSVVNVLLFGEFSNIEDECHIISAYINRCDGIITYDSHFQSAADKIKIFSPEQFIQEILS